MNTVKIYSSGHQVPVKNKETQVVLGQKNVEKHCSKKLNGHNTYGYRLHRYLPHKTKP